MFPTIFLVSVSFYAKKLTQMSCIILGFFIIITTTLVIPYVEAMKNTESELKQREILTAINVVIENQNQLAKSLKSNTTANIVEVPSFMTNKESSDFSSFLSIIRTYDIFLTIFGLAFGINIISMGLQGKLPSPKAECTCTPSSKIAEQHKSSNTILMILTFVLFCLTAAVIYLAYKIV